MIFAYGSLLRSKILRQLKGRGYAMNGVYAVRRRTVGIETQFCGSPCICTDLWAVPLLWQPCCTYGLALRGELTRMYARQESICN